MDDITDKTSELLCPLGVDTPREAMLVWDWGQTPDFIRKLSNNGGDEDGVAWIPNGVKMPFWMERLWHVFGEPQAIRFQDGLLVIWAHA